MLRRKFSVVIEKTVRELAGKPCLKLSEVDPPKHEICCSRMFGKRLTTIEPIEESVATYTQRAAEKLRAQNSLCKKIPVSIRTSMLTLRRWSTRIARWWNCQPYQRGAFDDLGCKRGG